MPVYCYTTRDGQTVEKHYPMGEAPEKVRVGGKVARRDYVAEGRRGGMMSANWPMVPDMSFGFYDSQMDEVRDNDKKHGLSSTKYTKVDGAYVPVIENPHHYKRYCESQGMFHRNAGFNDALPNNC